MIYFAAPALCVLLVGVIALDFKIGFWVADRTRNTGFDVGFYLLTVIGLFASQVSFVTWLAIRYGWVVAA